MYAIRSYYDIGDGRIYRLHKGQLEQLTEDHRLVVSESESYLSRALGMDSQVMLDYIGVEVEKGDLFLFTTDGIYEYLNDDAMIDIIERHA